MESSEKRRIEWQLKCLTAEASNLKPNDLDWTIKMEQAYSKQGYLTQPQKNTLDSIYERYA
jgi:hypothetical protein